MSDRGARGGDSRGGARGRARGGDRGRGRGGDRGSTYRGSNWRGGRGNGQGTRQSQSDDDTPSGGAQTRGGSYNARGGGRGRGGNESVANAPASSVSNSTITAPPKTKEWYEQRYKILEPQQEIIRQQQVDAGLVDPKDTPEGYSSWAVTHGLCQDMCPEFERVRRITQNDLMRPEYTTESLQLNDRHARQPNEEAMVKAYRRPAADMGPELVTEIRPPSVCRKTMDYMIKRLDHEDFAFLHDWILDRARGVKKDLTIHQNRPGEAIVEAECREWCVRLGFVALHRMARSDYSGEYALHEEVKKLTDSLSSCRIVYNANDVNRYHTEFPNEPEIEAYRLVAELAMVYDTVANSVSRLPASVRRDRRFRIAQLLHRAGKEALEKPKSVSDAQKKAKDWWDLIRSPSVSFIMACCAQLSFTKIRRRFFDTIHRLFRRQTCPPKDWPLTRLMDVLGFDDEEARTYCEARGYTLITVDGEICLDPSSYSAEEERRDLIAEYPGDSIVENKLAGRLLSTVIEEAEPVPDALPNGADDDSMFLGQEIADTGFVTRKEIDDRKAAERQKEAAELQAEAAAIFGSTSNKTPALPTVAAPSLFNQSNGSQPTAAASSSLNQTNFFQSGGSSAQPTKLNLFGSSGFSTQSTGTSQPNPFGSTGTSQPNPFAKNSQVPTGPAANNPFGSKPNVPSGPAANPFGTNTNVPTGPAANNNPFAKGNATQTSAPTGTFGKPSGTASVSSAPAATSTTGNSPFGTFGKPSPQASAGPATPFTGLGMNQTVQPGIFDPNTTPIRFSSGAESASPNPPTAPASFLGAASKPNLGNSILSGPSTPLFQGLGTSIGPSLGNSVLSGASSTPFQGFGTSNAGSENATTSSTPQAANNQPAPLFSFAGASTAGPGPVAQPQTQDDQQQKAHQEQEQQRQAQAQEQQRKAREDQERKEKEEKERKIKENAARLLKEQQEQRERERLEKQKQEQDRQAQEQQRRLEEQRREAERRQEKQRQKDAIMNTLATNVFLDRNDGLLIQFIGSQLEVMIPEARATVEEERLQKLANEMYEARRLQLARCYAVRWYQQITKKKAARKARNRRQWLKDHKEELLAAQEALKRGPIVEDESQEDQSHENDVSHRPHRPDGFQRPEAPASATPADVRPKPSKKRKSKAPTPTPYNNIPTTNGTTATYTTNTARVDRTVTDWFKLRAQGIKDPSKYLKRSRDSAEDPDDFFDTERKRTRTSTESAVRPTVEQRGPDQLSNRLLARSQSLRNTASASPRARSIQSHTSKVASDLISRARELLSAKPTPQNSPPTVQHEFSRSVPDLTAEPYTAGQSKPTGIHKPAYWARKSAFVPKPLYGKGPDAVSDYLRQSRGSESGNSNVQQTQQLGVMDFSSPIPTQQSYIPTQTPSQAHQQSQSPSQSQTHQPSPTPSQTRHSEDEYSQMSENDEEDQEMSENDDEQEYPEDEDAEMSENDDDGFDYHEEDAEDGDDLEYGLTYDDEEQNAQFVSGGATQDDAIELSD